MTKNKHSKGWEQFMEMTHGSDSTSLIRIEMKMETTHIPCFP